MKTESLETLRVTTLGVSGLICLLYAILALVMGQPDPMPFWIPALAGIATALAISIGAMLSGHRNTARAMDESYVSDRNRAQSNAYWVALLLYPVFGVLLSQGLVSWEVAFAAMGTLTGASFLLLFTWFDIKGRQ